MSTKVISLVSIGAHPSSGRARRAEQDARAVVLGLQLAGDNLQVVHAGDTYYAARNVMHGVVALEEDSVIIDTFTPPRADFLPQK